MEKETIIPPILMSTSIKKENDWKDNRTGNLL